MATTTMTAPVRDWLLVADSKDTVLISVLGGGLVKVHVKDAADAAPAVDDAFHPLTQNAPFSLFGVSSPQKVYIQSGGPVSIDTQVTAV